MTDPSLPKSRPHWLATSVRGLIVLVLVLGTAMGWVSRSARIQREAVAAIRHAGGGVYYDWDQLGPGKIHIGEPRAPKWLADVIGVDYFGHITWAWFPSSSTSVDPVLVHVGRLTRLEHLYFDHSALSDTGLAHFKALSNISTLGLSDTAVSDHGLAHLKGLTELTILDLHGTQVSDAGMAQLKGLTELTYLCLSGTRVSDRGLEHLQTLTKLWRLDLRRTQVTQAGLVRLKCLSNLRYVDLDCSQLTDSGVAEIEGALPGLTIIR